MFNNLPQQFNNIGLQGGSQGFFNQIAPYNQPQNAPGGTAYNPNTGATQGGGFVQRPPNAPASAQGTVYGGLFGNAQAPSQPNTQSVQGASTTQPGVGGGGGDSQLVQLQKAAQTPGGLNPVYQQQLNDFLKGQNVMPDQTQQISDTYNDVFNQLNSQEAQVRQGYPSLEQTFTGPIDAMRPDLQNAFQQGNTLNQQQQTQTYQNQDNALAAARALYNEVNQGAAQRFGGSRGTGTGVSSAADFANEFYARQLGQNQGNIYNTTSQNIGQLQAQAQNINTEYQNNLQKIDLQKSNAVAQAQQTFQQQLQAINSARDKAQQEKAVAKLQLLQDLRSNIQNIQNQYTQFQQTAYLQQQQANNTLRNAIEAYKSMGTNPISLGAYATPGYAAIGGGMASAGQNPLFTSGQVGQGQRVDQNGNPIR